MGVSLHRFFYTSTSQLSRDIHFHMAKRIRKYTGTVQNWPVVMLSWGCRLRGGLGLHQGQESHMQTMGPDAPVLTSLRLLILAFNSSWRERSFPYLAPLFPISGNVPVHKLCTQLHYAAIVPECNADSWLPLLYIHTHLQNLQYIKCTLYCTHIYIIIYT